MPGVCIHGTASLSTRGLAVRLAGSHRSDPWHLPCNSGRGEQPCQPRGRTVCPATETSCFPANACGWPESAERSVCVPPRAVKPGSAVPVLRIRLLEVRLLTFRGTCAHQNHFGVGQPAWLRAASKARTLRSGRFTFDPADSYNGIWLRRHRVDSRGTRSLPNMGTYSERTSLVWV